MDFALPSAIAPLLAALPPVLGLVAAALVIARLRRRLVTAEARAENEATLAAQRTRRLGLLAQDIAQPGLSLLGLAERLEGADHGAAAVLRLESARLLSLSDEIADELAARSGARRLREEPLALPQLIDQAMEAVRRPLGDGVRHWRADPGLEGLTVLGDRRALCRVMTQVLARAVRETRQGDCIAVRAVHGPDTLALVVEDEGAGLSPGDLALGEGEGTRGLGLGLATARDLLRAHGGELRVEASAGIGTRAWLTLPRVRILRGT
ncbi:HAMP domain-containing histidine kinase [Roseomonas sp. OT10]|uniref:sensor histidine kinase n=1 Tax=Roseomonas cutis TaxID=2897332 RepID=UPI001E2F4CF6|nr:HAMP domain-containing sensor histidine kinase [Roseomonas sp. OT10]UFN50219.1 HAMP domain-containing histidine kinase [Roseomonas sp. OT10]